MNKAYYRKQLAKELNIDKLRPLKQDDCILLFLHMNENRMCAINQRLQYEIVKMIYENTNRKVLMLPNCLDVIDNLSKEDYDTINNILEKYRK